MEPFGPFSKDERLPCIFLKHGCSVLIYERVFDII